MKRKPTVKQICKVLREAQFQLQGALADGECGYSSGLCNALSRARSVLRYTYSDVDHCAMGKMFPSRDINLDDDNRRESRRIEKWEDFDYWATSLHLHKWEYPARRRKTMKAYTARVMLLELTALMLEDGAL